MVGHQAYVLATGDRQPLVKKANRPLNKRALYGEKAAHRYFSVTKMREFVDRN